ncbi:MAG: bifunctional glutamate N-acetyltransferase/amino-acid acetyltransferase ArgJ [Candidatus Mycalebacterium zealandia]|nr:MAG: bifunctional glutamate N-acetyltransferase/amino-acid acetyltransferase ArgJ [Candidatus Mycalebacterium zealandia]
MSRKMKNTKNYSIPGFLFGSVSCGIKNRKDDLAIIYAEQPATAAAIFTTNRLKAAPVLLGMDRIKKGVCQALLLNSGHANAMTGSEGEKAAKATTLAIARNLKIPPSLVIPSSTGLIGGKFPAEKITKALPRLVSTLSPGGAKKAAGAIITTDKFVKIASRKIKIGGKTGTVRAIGKGAGMINPNMATMLCFVLTDVKISKSFAAKTLREAAGTSFNRIIVDGEMSTNDSVFLLSSGAAENKTISSASPDGRRFSKAVSEVCFDIAQMIVQDGEGATKVARIEVEGAKNVADADKAARAVGNSLLVKCALFGEDPNFGRIASAAGASGVKFNPAKLDIWIDKLKVVSRGKETQNAEKKAAKLMKKSEFTIKIRFSEGKAKAFVLASDLSLDYVRLNSEYRS